MYLCYHTLFHTLPGISNMASKLEQINMLQTHKNTVYLAFAGKLNRVSIGGILEITDDSITSSTVLV